MGRLGEGMDKHWCLENINLFSGLTEEEAEQLSRTSRLSRVSKNDPIYMQGDPSNTVYFLSQGMVKISRINPEGRKLTIDLIEPGNFFGELSLAGERERRNFAEALENSVYCEIQKDHLESFLAQRPDIAIKLLKVIGDSRLTMENLLEDMTFMDVPARVTSLLLKYAENDLVRIPLTHQEIADLTGSTRVSVSRAIARLRNDGLIETGGDRIRLIKNVELQELVHNHLA